MKNQFHVEVNVDEVVGKELVALVRESVVKTLIHEAVEPHIEISILLTDDLMMRKLNETFMGNDETTDVLSFPVGAPMPGVDQYLGDIAISIPAAKRQADEAGHPLAEELRMLAIHATLHLLGYDHATAEEKQNMWSIQDSILSDQDRESAEDNVY